MNREIPNIAGNWEGTWADTIYVWATGALTCTILQDDTYFTATGTIDMSVFGMGIVPGTGEGTVTRDGDRATLDFTFSASGIGNGAGTVHMLKDTPVEPSTWGAIKGRYAESDE